MASTATPPKQEVQDLMEIVVAMPPNFELIQVALPHASHLHTYCYCGKIYNPSGKKLPIDIQYHEHIHMQQQEDFGDSDGWWNKYLMDADFRLEQELQAYGHQYAFAKNHLIEADEDIRTKTLMESMAYGNDKKRLKHLGGGVNNILRELLFSMASALSGEAYGSLLSFSAAETAIKRYAKK